MIDDVDRLRRGGRGRRREAASRLGNDDRVKVRTGFPAVAVGLRRFGMGDHGENR